MSLRFFIKTILLGLILLISYQPASFGQISSIQDLLSNDHSPKSDVSEAVREFRAMCTTTNYPYGFGLLNLPMMHGLDFIALSDELPFLEGDKKLNRYSEFWVNTEVLNVRSGPSLEYEIISETYYGNLVFAFAKKGDWVAVSFPIKIEDVELKPRWVHIKYLSANKIDEQVDSKVLKRKCSFKTYGKLNKEKLYNPLNHTYRPCDSVMDYLRHQRLLSGKRHDYWQQYEVWRNSQELPEKYNSQSC